jgi:hypothetical protein
MTTVDNRAVASAAAAGGVCVCADEGIPDFWLNAMTNHDMVGEFITEVDSEVLAYLTDVRSSSLTGDQAGSFKLSFHFRENPFFKNKVGLGPGVRVFGSGASGCVSSSADGFWDQRSVLVVVYPIPYIWRHRRFA